MYSPMSNTKLYIVAFNCLVGVGFAFFLGIILLYIFKYCLCRNFLWWFLKKSWNAKNIFLPNQAHNDTEEMEVKYYAQYREELELLALDQNNLICIYVHTQLLLIIIIRWFCMHALYICTYIHILHHIEFIWLYINDIELYDINFLLIIYIIAMCFI